MSKHCVCCGTEVGQTDKRAPLCGDCVAPGEARSYCATCGHRGSYPYADFVRVMAAHYPGIALGESVAVRLPACAACKDDGRPLPADARILFYGIDAA